MKCTSAMKVKNEKFKILHKKKKNEDKLTGNYKELLGFAAFYHLVVSCKVGLK